MTIHHDKLCVHHIGGRFGTGGFPHIPAFEKDLVRVYYDADRDCIEQIGEKHKRSQAELLVLPCCLGSRTGKGTFNINYDTTASSVFPHNREYAGYYFFSYNHDFLVSDAMRTMETRETDIDTLDSVIGCGTAPLPDFLSMDVQGSEYDIIAGARDTLRRGTAGLVIETGLLQLYEGQKLFGDICSLLEPLGFSFVRFLRFHDYAPSRNPVGLRGYGCQMLADVLFLRKPESVISLPLDDTSKNLLLEKMAFTGIVFGQLEYATQCLQAAGTGSDVTAGATSAAYRTFLSEFREEAGRMARRFPPLFSEKYSFSVSKGRFATDEKRANDTTGFIKRLWLRHFYPRVYAVATIYDLVYEGVWGSLAQHILPNTPVEKILTRYGFVDQARCVKKKRIIQRPFSRKPRN